MGMQVATAELKISPVGSEMAIHTKLDEVLEERGKSLYWLQQQTGVSYTALLKLRKDRARSMDYGVLEKICEALECEPSDLIVRVSEEEKSKGKRKG